MLGQRVPCFIKKGPNGPFNVNEVTKKLQQHKDMSIPEKISTPNLPRFLFAPDEAARQLYIICTRPLALIWVRQTVPAQLYILEGPRDEQMLRDAGAYYKAHVEGTIGGN
jgi:hypothetical protein